MKRQILTAVMAAAAALAMVGCDKAISDAPKIPANEPMSMELLARTASGFTVGQQMSTRTAYVFYDMQCPHCGHLWESAKPLQANVKFVWVPVGVLSRASIAQGSTILASADPAKAMDEHKTSLLNNSGGMAADSDAMDKFEGKIKTNTELLTALKANSVPFIVTKDPQTGELITSTGALPTEGLRAFLKL